MTAHALAAHALAAPSPRGACPGLSAPMPTGDGLLVRLLPIGTIPLAAFGALCAAARTHGNGVIEVTSRGSIQVRGLSAASAPPFAAAVAALGIAAEDGVPVHCNPLTGIDTEEIFDAAALAGALRRRLAQQSMAARLSAKISIAIDGGGLLNLATLSADIRLRALATADGVVLHVSVGGDESSAADLGIIVPADGVEAVMRLLEVLAKRGRTTRARDVLAREGATTFRSAIDGLVISARPRESGDPKSGRCHRRLACTVCATDRRPAASGSLSAMPMRLRSKISLQPPRQRVPKVFVLRRAERYWPSDLSRRQHPPLSRRRNGMALS